MRVGGAAPQPARQQGRLMLPARLHELLGRLALGVEVAHLDHFLLVHVLELGVVVAAQAGRGQVKVVSSFVR